ncbi:MAG: hypothetical protein LBU46_06395 [Candidatus Accumulibacter sp.]|jgi:hypothetical protein|nr:hypothetical protein [Accumulibacter sp.]
MRIGEINQDNYARFARLLGVKNAKNPFGDKSGEDIPGVTRERTREECNEASIRAGYAEAWQFHDEGDVSWKKIIPVSDDIRQAVIDLERKHIVTNANGTATAKQGDEMAALMMRYAKTLPESERSSAIWTLGRIAGEEGERIGDYIKAQIPGWQPGQSFDRRILTDTNFGQNDSHVDVLA